MASTPKPFLFNNSYIAFAFSIPFTPMTTPQWGSISSGTGNSFVSFSPMFFKNFSAFMPSDIATKVIKWSGFLIKGRNFIR